MAKQTQSQKNDDDQKDVGAKAKSTQATTQAQEAPSVFDQAVQFSMSDHVDGSKATKARELWDALECDEMPAKLAVAVFDCALDQGQAVAERLLGKTHAAILDLGDETAEDAIVINFLAWRLRRYAFTGNASTSMQGWSKHILQLHNFIFTGLKA